MLVILVGAILARGRRTVTKIVCTLGDLACGLVAHLLHWFPERKFPLVGDGGYSTRDLAAFCHRHRKRLALIGTFPADAALSDAPPELKTVGRPRVRGRRRRSPQQVVRDGGLELTAVKWYGRTSRQVNLKTASAHWYQPEFGLIPVPWVSCAMKPGRGVMNPISVHSPGCSVRPTS